MNSASTEKHKSTSVPRTAHAHVVYFSEGESSLVMAACEFLKVGLRTGERCIVIATPAHREQIEQALRVDGFDLPPDFYYSLDAADTLARILIDGQPDQTCFTEAIAPLIKQNVQENRTVRIFEEMAALLWKEENYAGAMQLEEFWNELGQMHSFALFCAYPLQGSDTMHYEDAFTQICQQHARIVPGESYTLLSEQERIRTLIGLQQKVRTLEKEIAEIQAAQEHTRTLAAIVESSDDAILSKDLSGIVTSWNTAAQRIYGYTPEEMIGTHVTRIFPPDRYEEFEQIMARIRRGEPVDHFETRRMRKDGTQLLVSITISPVRDHKGVIYGASTIARDITGQRRLEARSQHLFASNLIGIFVVDENGAVQEVNQAFLDLIGYTVKEWQLEARRTDTTSSFSTAFLRPLLQSAQASNGPADPQETIMQHRSGRLIPVLVALTRIEHTQTSIGFVLDISERKALEQRKDAFIGMASHELKTPVTSLKGYMSLLQRLLSQQENEKVLHYLTRMDMQIGKLIKLINDLLDISRMQSGQLDYYEELVEMDALVQEIVESVQETAHAHDILLEGASHSYVLGDRERLGQVIMNLLNNAVKYSPDDSTVHVYISMDREQLLIRVQDFGLGIDKEHHQKIFERFYRVMETREQTYPGLGIGLAISQEIVRRHNGQLWVESERGKGANFYLRLPVVQQQSSSSTEADAEKGNSSDAN